ncbi:S41 family peptidase [Nonomuraea angiospora]|uniref:S41 family peptidase n=1 Tax=Nonomuraea angiospora TaxID=46172 RepID=UPI0029B8E4AD|nr:S41 family peptidase [Nonomuraea angiospora]MDX3107422.1 S41 family peptidase [Nonomuraea angiospora]
MTAVMTAIRTATAGLALLLAAACTAPTAPRSQASSAASTVCAKPYGRLPAQTPTTIDVIEQAYFCILGNYYSGATMDARSLLTAGFIALTRELNLSGRDVSEASMPALTGDREADWTAFEAVYRKVTAQVPDLSDKLAVVTLEAIVAALDDNHARWVHGGGGAPPGYYDGDGYGLGLQASVYGAQVNGNPGAALPPLFVTTVEGGAAQSAGVRPGDIIESIDGSAPFIDGKPIPAIAALYPQYPQAGPVKLRLLRQSTGRRWSVTLKPGVYERDLAALQGVTSKLLEDGIAYVRVRGFGPDAADRVFKAISRLRTGRTLTGIVLDLRGNGGGSPKEAIRLLSAFVHGKDTAYLCTVDAKCEALRTDDTVELLNLPLAVLIDRSCASACEHFSSAAKDLGIGKLVGTRTAGAISGPSEPYKLGNNTMLAFPTRHHLGPNRETLDRIGVPPDHYVPLTPKDAAAGRDPALSRALTLLHK